MYKEFEHQIEIICTSKHRGVRSIRRFEIFTCILNLFTNFQSHKSLSREILSNDNTPPSVTK